ncbi:hypothetical protein MRX96_022958 [Rhipicephalus microplus]
MKRLQGTHREIVRNIKKACYNVPEKDSIFEDFQGTFQVGQTPVLAATATGRQPIGVSTVAPRRKPFFKSVWRGAPFQAPVARAKQKPAGAVGEATLACPAARLFSQWHRCCDGKHAGGRPAKAMQKGEDEESPGQPLSP